MTIKEARRAWENWIMRNPYSSALYYAQGVVDGLQVSENIMDDPDFVLSTYRSKFIPQEATGSEAPLTGAVGRVR